MLPIETITHRINVYHDAATGSAATAVYNAKAAGDLLLELKANLPHGKFVKCITAHTKVSIRQAQRYMAVAQDKPIPLRKLADKNDTVSHLENQYFVPLPRHIFFAKDVGEPNNHFVVESCSQHPTFFFVSHITNDERPDMMTTRPVEAIAVHDKLVYFGMPEPLKANWRSKKSQGVMEACESVYGPSESPPKLVVPRLSPRRIDIDTGEIDWDETHLKFEMTDEFKRLAALEGSKSDKFPTP